MGGAPAVEAHMQGVRDAVHSILRRRLLVVDEKPTLTRMFTFSGHVHGLLLMDLLGCADSLVQLRGTKAQVKARKRMDKVRAFLKFGGLSQYLRRTSMCLQLIDHTMSLCSQLPGDGDPVLVRLSKGVVDQRITEDLVRLMSDFYLDPALDATTAVPALLGTALDVWLRFSQYQAWPYAMWKLTKKFNPDNYVGACLDFLNMKDDDLDVGFSVPLKTMALGPGNTEMQGLRWLTCDQVQSALLLILSASAASSLPIERSFAEVKRSEAPRLCHVATAGRNQVLRQHLRQREDLLREGELAAAILRRSTRLRLTSLARELRPELWDRDGIETTQFVQANATWLRQELERRRREAKLAVDRAASQDVPVTQAEWTEWFATNEVQFRELMDTSAAARRNSNHRLHADPAAPPAIPRIRPVDDKVKKLHIEQWQQVLWGRSGWVCLAYRGRATRLLWLHSAAGQTFCLDLTVARLGKDYVLDENSLRLLRSTLTSLDKLEVAEVDQALVCSVKALPEPRLVRLVIQAAKVVKQPLAATRRARKRKAPGEEADDEAAEPEDNDQEEESAFLQAAKEDLSGSSSAGSVDTDLDSGVDECLNAAVVQVEQDDAAVSDLSEPPDEDAGEEDAQAEVASMGAGMKPSRHAPGTWTIWSSAWFYITKTPGYTDVKCWVRSPLRNADRGMGVKGLSRTMTPAHYEESWDSATRTVFLLRAWSLWRAEVDGWVTHKPSRVREQDRLRHRLLEDLKAYHAESVVGPFLLGCKKGDKVLRELVPGIATDLDSFRAQAA